MILITFIDGILFSLLSIVIVIAIIFIIIISITPLRKLSPQKTNHINQEKTKIELNDDLMAAILIASIDYRETTKKEPKLMSITEIE
ncbi:MAG: hypothetical protein WC152_03535 [Candidatus Izemoplasmatales bacterium]